jgi:putative transposase
VKYLIHDNDTQLTKAVDHALRRKRIKVVRTAHCAPSMQAYVEHFIQSLRTEVLEHFVIFGKQHLNHLVKEFLEYYHTERPHQGEGIDNQLLVSAKRTKHAVAPTLRNILYTERLGGLLKSYSAKAA